MAPLPAATLPIVPGLEPLTDLLDLFVKHATNLRNDLAALDSPAKADVRTIRDFDTDKVLWANVTIDGTTTSVCTPVYQRIADLVRDCAGRSDWHETGVHVGWEMTRDEWNQLSSVLAQHPDVPYIAALMAAGKLDR